MKTHIKLKIRFRLIQSACLILFLLAAQACAIKNDLSFSRVDPSMGQRVQKELDAAVAEYNVPGAVLALRDMDGKTQTWTSGLAELETKKAMSKDLYLMIGSTTKSYTATMVLQLVDDGLIKLDEPIGKYLPGLVPRENKITIRHLLEMRSGLGAYGRNPEFTKFMEPKPSFSVGKYRTPIFSTNPPFNRPECPLTKRSFLTRAKALKRSFMFI
jgi:D-alanyl-D-alanine carboxypeptidase